MTETISVLDWRPCLTSQSLAQVQLDAFDSIRLLYGKEQREQWWTAEVMKQNLQRDMGKYEIEPMVFSLFMLSLCKLPFSPA